MPVQTPYEAVLYCRSDNGTTYCLGNVGDKINKDMKSLMTKELDRAFWVKLMDHLYDALELNPSIPFARTDDIKCHVSKCDDRGLFRLFFWMGKGDGPTYKIMKANRYRVGSPANEHKVKMSVPSICLEFSLETMLYLDSDVLILKPLNYYLKTCNEEELKDMLDENKIFRCIMYQDDSYSLPYAYNSSTQLSRLAKHYQIAAANCSPEHILCEMGAIYTGYFYCVPRKKVEARQPITAEDLVKLD